MNPGAEVVEEANGGDVGLGDTPSSAPA
jgi:hypothetical protein